MVYSADDRFLIKLFRQERLW